MPYEEEQDYDYHHAGEEEDEVQRHTDLAVAPYPYALLEERQSILEVYVEHAVMIDYFNTIMLSIVSTHSPLVWFLMI